jgi:hypothetical protein
MVAEENKIDLVETQRWSEVEGKLNEFQKIKSELKHKKS